MKGKIKILAAGLLLAVVAGCAMVTDSVPDEQVINISGNVYEILDVDRRGIFGSEDSLKDAVITQANKFAESKGKVASPISARIHRVGVLADWAWFYYKFELVDHNTPKAYRNITDIKIVRDARLASEFYTERHLQDESGDTEDITYKIRELDQLRKEGLLSDSEFETQKKKLLENQ